MSGAHLYLKNIVQRVTMKIFIVFTELSLYIFLNQVGPTLTDSLSSSVPFFFFVLLRPFLLFNLCLFTSYNLPLRLCIRLIWYEVLNSVEEFGRIKTPCRID